MDSKTILLLLLTIFPAGSGVHINHVCGFSTFSCFCQRGVKAMSMNLTAEIMPYEDPDTGKIYCEKQTSDEACSNVFCSFYRIELKINEIENYPSLISQPTGPRHSIRVIHLAPGKSPKKSRSRSRRSGQCSVRKMPTASIFCIQTRTAKMCKITCTYGLAHETVDGGSTKTKYISCRNYENVWEPHGFKKCKPYINCEMVLTAAGDIRCSRHLDDGPFCWIRCYDYSQNGMTPFEKYYCYDGVVTPKLPFCAGLKNVTLIPPPTSTTPARKWIPTLPGFEVQEDGH